MLVETNSEGGVPRLGPTPQKNVLADVCRVRALLNGLSVVDSTHLVVPDRAAVDAHLRLCEFDTDNPLDLRRLELLLLDAVSYLREQHGYEFPLSVEQPDTIHDLFLTAAHGSDEERHLAVMCIKVMHILNHIQGRELVFNAAVPESELVNRLHTKVLTTVDHLRGDGIKLTEWAAGQKTQASLVTKLLAKRNTLASRIFDRLRYRIVTETEEDLVMALVGFARRLVPFNYVIPGQSQNGIVTLRRIADTLGVPLAVVQEMWGETVEGEAPTPPNEFSGATYRCVNFVADIPLRVDDLGLADGPAVAFVQAEFQLVDAVTHEKNNAGENAHERYKARQLTVVKNRLEGKRV
ncbi:MAG: TIGR04552 family protein [Myxococcota bacterium]